MIDGLAAGGTRGAAGGSGDESSENGAGDAATCQADGAAHQTDSGTNLSTGQRNRDATGHACSSTDSATNPPRDVAWLGQHGLTLRTGVTRAGAKEFTGIRRPCLVIVDSGMVMHAQ